jgi:hypothetical protein
MANETGSLVEEKPVGVALTTDIHSRFVVAGVIKTHFLEAGSHVVRNAGRCPHIDAPGEFNTVALRFPQRR